MTTGATGQLGLALPVQGELSGTWGDTVNNGITQYTNIAIAATLTLTNDGAVTLANTTGDASATNIVSSLTGAGTVTAQFAIVRVTGTLTTAKVITAPSYSKTYVVVNAATGGIVTFKASGQTGVSIAVGESAWVYYNGTDYVKIAGTTSGSAGGSNTQVQFNSSGSLAGDADLTFDGTTLSTAGLTASGTVTLSGGTANGVTYLNGSKVLTSGSALTFDGTALTSLNNASSQSIILSRTSATARNWALGIDGDGGFRLTDATGSAVMLSIIPSGVAYLASASELIFKYNTSVEGMRLTSNGLGIGTSSPSQKLEVAGNIYINTSGNPSMTVKTTGAGNNPLYRLQADTNYWDVQGTFSNAGDELYFMYNGSTKMVLSSAGGFSVGTTADPGAGAIYATGNITAYYSDDRLKTRLGVIENALDKVDQLQGFYYEANETAQALGYKVKREVGVSAQSVQAVLPEIVSPAPIDQQYLTVDYERLVPLLIEAVKELTAKVKALESK